VATEPKLCAALLWVVVGILTSIIFWEIIKYIAQVKKIESEIPGDNEKPTMTKTDGSVKFNAAALRRIELHKYVENKLISKNIAKVTTIDIATVGFGIAVGLLALLNQGYVTAIRLVEPIDIAALFGLGLGIGSLREFVTKATE
jgi:hypothetical protein